MKKDQEKEIGSTNDRKNRFLALKLAMKTKKSYLPKGACRWIRYFLGRKKHNQAFFYEFYGGSQSTGSKNGGTEGGVTGFAEPSKLGEPGEVHILWNTGRGKGESVTKPCC